MPFRETSESGPVLVLTTTQLELLTVVQSLLRSAEIPFLVQGEHALSQLPAGDLAGPFAKSGLAARIFVPAARAEETRELLSSSGTLPEEDT